MAALPGLNVPILTEAVDFSVENDREILIAELQTRLAAAAFELTDDIMRSAFAEMEASIFEQVSGRLRRELPEMIDALLREHIAAEKNRD